jgi:hypothetical protein
MCVYVESLTYAAMIGLRTCLMDCQLARKSVEYTSENDLDCISLMSAPAASQKVR